MALACGGDLPGSSFCHLAWVSSHQSCDSSVRIGIERSAPSPRPDRLGEFPVEQWCCGRDGEAVDALKSGPKYFDENTVCSSPFSPVISGLRFRAVEGPARPVQGRRCSWRSTGRAGRRSAGWGWPGSRRNRAAAFSVPAIFPTDSPAGPASIDAPGTRGDGPERRYDGGDTDGLSRSQRLISPSRRCARALLAGSGV